jgi:conjugal transfer pilus assembly protein TraU
MFNPITDICWSCVFPISIGGGKIESGQEDSPDATTRGICSCGSPIPKFGIGVGFWEPVRVVEVVRTPYCFVTLGGLTLDPGFQTSSGVQSSKREARAVDSFYQAHWYTAPLLFWLEALLDDSCLERGVFDLAYFTEVDPLWQDSEMSFILNPDAGAFANIVAQSACAADCVAATAGFPSNMLFWCAGCQGPMYPLTGNVGAHVGGVQASALLAQRLTNKMHREGLIWAASGDGGMCGYYPQMLMDKRNYKMQMIYPVPNTQKVAGRCCQPLGRSTAVWGAGKEYPIAGEDFAYMMFRKRNCCQGAISLTEIF